MHAKMILLFGDWHLGARKLLRDTLKMFLLSQVWSLARLLLLSSLQDWDRVTCRATTAVTKRTVQNMAQRAHPIGMEKPNRVLSSPSGHLNPFPQGEWTPLSMLVKQRASLGHLKRSLGPTLVEKGQAVVWIPGTSLERQHLRDNMHHSRIQKGRQHEGVYLAVHRHRVRVQTRNYSGNQNEAPS